MRLEHRDRPHLVLLGLALLLVAHTTLLGWGAVLHSPTIDEIGWLASGVAHWKSHRLDIVINHPPHVGLIAAVPLLAAGAETELYPSSVGSRTVANDFIRRNGSRSFWLFTLGRWMCIPFSLFGAIGCFLWARDLYGARSGLFAAALWCFCPNIIAHGQLVSHDTPASSLGLISMYSFWRWLYRPDGRRTLIAGGMLGLSLLAKMTMLVNVLLWPLLWIFWRLAKQNGGHERKRKWLVDGLMLATSLVIALDVLNLAYWFRGSFTPLGSYRFQSQLLAGSSSSADGGFASSIAGSIPVPLPRSYMEGIDFQRYALEGNLPFQCSYLRGVWSHTGWSYYYLYAFMVKVPLGTLCLMLLALGVRVLSCDNLHRGHDEMVVLSPAAALLLAASVSPTWTDHFRYVLPALPLIFVWVSRIAGVQFSAHPWLISSSALAFAWSITSSLWAYPDSLSFFNELAGGPRGGAYHLLSSNIDYGQDLLKLKRWYDSHTDARPLGLAYWDMDSIDPRLAGIDYHIAPSGPAPGSAVNPKTAHLLGPQPGWYAVNVNLLHGDAWPGRDEYPELGFYGYFLEFQPVARAGYSIYIYHLSIEDVDRVRRRLQLPPVTAQ